MCYEENMRLCTKRCFPNFKFQKHGLPHMYLLLTLKHNCKISTPDRVNRYICAESPSLPEHPRLHDIVMKNMIHGSCGSWCFNEGKCSKHYPKPFRPENTIDENGYPYYRRRETGIRYHRYDDYTIDNTSVVPYSPILLQWGYIIFPKRHFIESSFYRNALFPNRCFAEKKNCRKTFYQIVIWPNRRISETL